MNFFATAHAKLLCDATGGILKRLMPKENLRRPYEDQILTVENFYEFGKELIKF